MAQKEIKTSIQISATPEKVWEILTNFQDYKNWNPFLQSVEGNVKKDETIKINAGGMKFKPKVLSFEENKQFSWVGRLFFKGLFDGEHLFLIEDNGDGTVTFRQEEKFQGILVGLFAKKLDTDTRQGFIKMNEKLKELSE